MTSGFRHRSAIVAVIATTAAMTAAPAAAGDAYPEFQVKAELVERFTRFIDWPADAMPGSDAPFVLCVLGDSPIVAPLKNIARKRKIKGRRAAVRVVTAQRGFDHCQVLFVPAIHAEALDGIVARTARRPILTIGDVDKFADRGLVIAFVRQRRHLGFAINVAAAADSGIVVRSNLLRLGKPVGGR